MGTAHHNRRSRSPLRFCTCHRTCAAWREDSGVGPVAVDVDERPSVAATVCDVKRVEGRPAGGRRAEDGGDCSVSDSAREGEFGSSPSHVGIAHDPRYARVSFITLQEKHSGVQQRRYRKGYRSQRRAYKEIGRAHV